MPEEAARTRGIDESSFAGIAKEPQRGSLAFMAGPVHAVDEKDVLPAVAVVVEKRAARAQSLREQLATVGAAVMPELDSSRACNVGQPESDGRSEIRKCPSWRDGRG